MSTALPPGNDNSNQNVDFPGTNYGYDSLTGHNPPNSNEQLESWETWMRSFKKEHGYCFDWLIRIFLAAPDYSYNAGQQQEVNLNRLIKAIQNPQKFLEVFWEIYENIVDLQNKKKTLEDDNRRLKNNDYSSKQNNSYFQRENQRLNNEVYRLEQENRSQVIQLQTRIEELEKEKEELQGKVSSLMGKLAERDRDRSSTITSDDSRRQRDSLTQEFIQLNNQDFTAASNEIFNYRCQGNPGLKEKRKQEIAKIKSILSKQIFKSGSQLVINRNSHPPEEYLPQAIQLLTSELLQELEMPDKANCPEQILKTLDNLISKGLKLVKDIVSDEPPGELLIDNEGTAFNPEIHQPVIGCEPSGKILYTTYPGYRVNNRIVGDALKAYVFTVPDEPAPSVGSLSTTVQQPTEPLGSTKGEIHPQIFSGRVTVQGSGLCYRNSCKWGDKDERTVINNQIVDFDAWAEGEMVEYKYKKSNVWFRVVKIELWLPSVYIHLDESISIGAPKS